MDTYVTQEGETLDPKLCSYVYPEGHEKAGLQCKGSRGRTGYCGGHSKAIARAMAPANGEDKDPGKGAAGATEGLQEQQAAAQAAQEMAQLSLTRRAAAFLVDEKAGKGRLLEDGWRDILRNGNDSDKIRLAAWLADRAEGRAGEAKPEPEVTVPTSAEELDRMTDAELAALLD